MRHPAAVLAIGIACAAGAGVAAASALTSPGGSPAGEAHGQYAAEPGTAVIDARAPDPAGGPDWAVRAYRTKTGLSCLEVSRAKGVQFGPADDRGGVHPTEPTDSGACADLNAEVVQLGVLRVAARGATPDRTILFGRAAPAVRAVSATTRAGDVTLALGPARTFLSVFDGLLDPAGFAVTATTPGGPRRFTP